MPKPKTSRKPGAKGSARARSAASKDLPRAPKRPAPSTSKQLVHTALRLHPDVRRRLEALRVQLGVTLNSLMNEGLAEFVAMRSAAVEVDMKSALARIKAYRRADPTFARDHLLIAQDEVATRGADPVEGTPYRVRRGPSLTAVDEIIAGSR